MEIKELTPRRGADTLRIGDSDDLVVMENFGSLPQGKIRLNNHSLIIICTSGMAQFEYDGEVIQIRKNDMFLYMRHCVGDNFMSSSDFNCRQIWFTISETWNVNMYNIQSFSDMVYLKQHPIVHLTDADVSLLDEYFKLLCRRMRDSTPMLYNDIVRSLLSTMMLEILCMFRLTSHLYLSPQNGGEAGAAEGTGNSHRLRIANKFVELVEKSDGRVRKVGRFASVLNVTPKYLSVLLKETMNCRPSDIIHLFTQKSIEHRLRFTDMTMQEIANDLNFPNSSFFGKYVKEHLGMTPLEYRKKYQK